MKHIAFKSLLLGASLATVLCACDENSWNDEHLNGFEKPTIEPKEIVTYDMTSSDVKKLAGLSTNKALARERGESALLEQVAQLGYFTPEIDPQYYGPAWLDSLAGVKGSPVYYLSVRSTLKLNYPTSDALPAELSGITGAPTMKVSEAQYQSVWESETDFVEAFSPLKPAAKFLPAILAEAYPSAAAGDFAVVTYNVASQDPVFGGGSTPDVPQPGFEMSNVAANITIGGKFTINGVVTAICKQGYILTDLSGSTLIYYGSGWDTSSVAIGEQRTVSGTCGAFGGCLQIDGQKQPITDEKVGEQQYTYPAPLAITGEIFEQFSVDRQALKADKTLSDNGSGAAPVYGEIKGAVFTKSGSFINFTVPGADASVATGSGYQIPSATESMIPFDQPCDVRGYIIGCSGKAYVTFLVTEVNGQRPSFAHARRAVASRAGVAIASTEKSAVYKFDGTAWSAPDDIIVLTSEDYEQMGARSSLTEAQAAACLPVYMARNYPYAAEDFVRYIVYNLAGKDTTTKNFVSRATFTGEEWAITTINTAMMQFVLADRGNGWSNWIYDPSIYIDLPAGKGASSADFWQKCVDWVYENVDVPEFGSTDIKSGVGYVTDYGNNEYFSGTSAYQCNVDLRPTAAKKQTPSVYKTMSDEAVVAQMKENFELKMMPKVLAEAYPDAQPGSNFDQYYVISFVMYDGSSHDEVIRYLVTAPGTFEFVDCTWNEE